LKIAEYLVDIPFKPDMPIADIIHLALKREEKSHNLYTDLAARADDAELKRTFEILATEELKHKNKFETMYDEQVLSEN
jgi:rubrerythrin